MRAAAAPATASTTQMPKVASARPAPMPPPDPASWTARSARAVPIAPAMTAEHDALGACEDEKRAPPGAACAEQCELAPVAVDRPERREICEPKCHERAGQGEHDVERLCVEGVACRAREAVREIVDEDDLARQ